MKKQFTAIYQAPETPGGRAMVDVPFNVWEAFDLRGQVPVKVTLNGHTFGAKLMPKGKGFYALSITKPMLKVLKVASGDTLQIGMEPDVPPERPEITPEEARRIGVIELVREPVNTACGQACVAMLAGVPIEDVFAAMHTRGPTTSTKVVDALYHYHIRHAEKFARWTDKNPDLPALCLLNVQMPGYDHWVLYQNGTFFDPEFGVLDACHPDGKIKSYLEIYP